MRERERREMTVTYIALSRLGLLYDERARGVRKALGHSYKADELGTLLLFGEHDGPVASVAIIEIAVNIFLDLSVSRRGSHSVRMKATEAGGIGGRPCTMKLNLAVMPMLHTCCFLL